MGDAAHGAGLESRNAASVLQLVGSLRVCATMDFIDVIDRRGGAGYLIWEPGDGDGDGRGGSEYLGGGDCGRFCRGRLGSAKRKFDSTLHFPQCPAGRNLDGCTVSHPSCC